MKTQLLVVTACLLAFAAAAQTTDLADRQLRGKVKSITEVEYEVVEKFGEPEKGKKKSVDYREYNSTGNITFHQLEDFTRDKAEKTVKSYRYSKNNKVVERKVEREGKSRLTQVVYNPEGKIATVDFTDGDGKLEQRQKYRYDAAGLLIQTDAYNGDGSLSSKTIYTNNAKEQLVKTESFDESGKLFDVRTYTYDVSGNMVKETDVDFWPKVTDTITRGYEYNEKKQKVMESYSKSNGGRKELLDAVDDRTFVYNEQGDLVSNTALFTEEKTAYTYDKHNNWIKAVKTSGSTLGLDVFGKPQQVILERQIKYY